jgi:hypothetical protein
MKTQSRERRRRDAAAEASGFTSVMPRRVTIKGMVWLELDAPLARHGRDEALADGGPHNNTANNMRVQVCPFLPAVHEAEGSPPSVTGQPPDGF